MYPSRIAAPDIRRLAWAAVLFLVALLLSSQAAAQGVRWEDYRGDQNVAPDASYNGPAGAPKFTNYPNSVAIANLRTVSANAANAVRRRPKRRECRQEVAPCRFGAISDPRLDVGPGTARPRPGRR